LDERLTPVPSGTSPIFAGVAPLTACPRCGSRLLQPLRSRPRSSDEVLVDLRCPECEMWMQGSFTKADAEELDRLQSTCRDQIVTAYEQSVSESMRALAFNLATALELDLLSADDFAPPRRLPRAA
jgi:hypothetical protein